MKKNEQKQEYTIPNIEELVLEVEKGFQESLQDIYIDEIEDGGGAI